MTDPAASPTVDLAAEQVLPVVVGAHLEAELTDRATAGLLRDAIAAWLEEVGVEDGPVPVVLTDLWYLNDQALRLRPTIAVGRPEINAATAFLGSRVPTALVVEHRFRIHLDPELVELNVCLWGPTAGATAEAVESFRRRYLGDYLAALTGMPPVAR